VDSDSINGGNFISSAEGIGRADCDSIDRAQEVPAFYLGELAIIRGYSFVPFILSHWFLTCKIKKTIKSI
jgi:hypothetical protein